MLPRSLMWASFSLLRSCSLLHPHCVLASTSRISRLGPTSLEEIHKRCADVNVGLRRCGRLFLRRRLELGIFEQRSKLQALFEKTTPQTEPAIPLQKLASCRGASSPGHFTPLLSTSEQMEKAYNSAPASPHASTSAAAAPPHPLRSRQRSALSCAECRRLKLKRVLPL